MTKMIRVAMGACLCVMAVTTISSAQTDRGVAGVQPFTFRAGQRVYIAAYQTLDHVTSRHLSAYPPGKIVDRHLPAELRIRQDFEKARRYTLVNKVSEADFVFLVLIHESAAEGVAVPPRVFTRYQSNIDIDALREDGYARAIVGPLKVHTLSRLSQRLVRAFHDAPTGGGGIQ